ncbi:pyridoxal-phosphate dependent enzyme [Halobaculum magnesiiphilum]|uniref:Pyridoxal-phosphate dependent enzyme n=1 Tax=Halobaculum magnesiiphilum TaxID=1017351 RepID=A0A8T8WCK2_9EURY|nr:pyridoxal-phosphate dependent enzyme [Halobaculum magnesiiphilum]QZP37587.1 pyridoxal-phosphate dependent enzyme [Halobaculum magnesiiphilum]
MTAPSLRCPDCGATYADRWRCECGHPLEYAEQPLPDRPAPDPAAFDTRDGLWSFGEFLPESPPVTLGEGMTPLVDAEAWDAQFKLEYVFPTGSFKDRGATTTVSRAAALGVDTLVEDSSGNAGAAIATYAARAGIDAEIYVPASVKDAKLRAIRRAGATPVRTEGPRQATTDACVEAVERAARSAAEGASCDEPRVTRAGWYASHAWNPAFFAGTATFAYETALQRDWEAPDAVVLPLGHGTLFLGAYRGFRALRDAGWIDGLPRLLGAQAAGTAPIVEALHGADAAAGDNDAADGIQIPEPVRREQILDAIDDTDGDAIALGSDPVESELADLHAAGFYTEPTCAVAPAALREYRERGVLDGDEDVVLPLTGSGLKT